MEIDIRDVVPRLRALEEQMRAEGPIDGFAREDVESFAYLWSRASPAEVATELGDEGNLAATLSDDCPACAPQWIALALRGAPRTRSGGEDGASDRDDESDVVILPGGAEIAGSSSAAGLLIVGGNLVVEDWLSIDESSTVVVAGDVKAHGLYCTGNLVVLGRIETDIVIAQGNGGLIAASQLSCRLYDNQQLTVHAAVRAESAVYDRESDWTRPKDVALAPVESLLAAGLFKHDPETGRAVIDRDLLKRYRATSKPIFRE